MTSYGSTAPARVREQVALWKQHLAEQLRTHTPGTENETGNILPE